MVDEPHIISLAAKGPKFDLRSTHARTSWDPNNALTQL